ncbi:MULTISPECIES: LysR family transcriptional regulator [Roseobacteraceae]|uniref:LysR family transcriptional regulator n=1 Tax=Celeribacter baekdonensis B30 TaxID=1208323 RepID=K2ILW1_9RHOB|nr:MULTISPECIES: LysR family transcriptional regulator [Roseobacteraceae]EKE71131.1 LysR family transcriptional regulator [Celeribacter baekdonensis B30]KAB6717099.1 LysR family transcriptional regulator [Roseobacter sp. TSBP12]|tara:strand:- start:9077 stop:9955 length:879 start_codon:yes stop_codon:yes gene_type:complete
MRKLPPLHALRAFEAAARHLHFADAAEELGLTPTAISHQVRQLEDILGVTLFHRFPRPVRLTAAGEKLFPVLRRALDQIAGTIDQLAITTAETPLRLSVTMAFASRWLMARLPRLGAETGLKITVEAADLPADLHASDIDMAIRYAGQPDDRAEWHRLFDDAIIPVCAPDLVNLPLTPDGIMALPLLDYRWKSASQNAPSWQRWHARADVKASLPAVAQTFSEEIHAIDAAVSGQGAVLASQQLVADLLNAGQLVQLSDIALPGLTYWAVFLSTHSDQDRLAQLLDWMRQQS